MPLAGAWAVYMKVRRAMKTIRYEKLRRHLTAPSPGHDVSLKRGESNHGGRPSCVAWPSKLASLGMVGSARIDLLIAD